MIMSVAWVFCAGAQTMSLRECLEKGLENNYRIRMARVDENAAAVNDSRGNAGGLPSVDISAGYSGSMYSRDVSERETGAVTSSRDITDHTLSASVGASWMVFNGFKIQATKERLHELHAQGELKTRIAIEDFVADMVSEYYY